MLAVAERLYTLFREGRISEQLFLQNALILERDCPYAAEYLLWLMDRTKDLDDQSLGDPIQLPLR